jgi:hypothetical protein
MVSQIPVLDRCDHEIFGVPEDIADVALDRISPS